MEGERKQHQSVVVRRSKKITRKRYSGSWKIALADFMTAMMALFLVLWLIATTGASDLEGVAEYFRTPLLVAMAGGDKSTASTSAIPGGGPDPVYDEGEEARVNLQQYNRPAEVQRSFNELRRKIHMKILQDPRLEQMRDQLRMYEVPEGLLIQVLDSDERAMFERGSDDVEPYMKRLLRLLAPILSDQPNKISVTGHTDAHPYPGDEVGYSNWELSTDRANASRRELMAGGLEEEKLLRVVGMADRVTMEGTDPLDSVNRRIELIVLDEEGLANAGLERVPSTIDLPFN